MKDNILFLFNALKLLLSSCLSYLSYDYGKKKVKNKILKEQNEIQNTIIDSANKPRSCDKRIKCYDCSFLINTTSEQEVLTKENDLKVKQQIGLWEKYCK